MYSTMTLTWSIKKNKKLITLRKVSQPSLKSYSIPKKQPMTTLHIQQIGYTNHWSIQYIPRIMMHNNSTVNRPTCTSPTNQPTMHTTKCNKTSHFLVCLLYRTSICKGVKITPFTHQITPVVSNRISPKDISLKLI